MAEAANARSRKILLGGLAILAIFIAASAAYVQLAHLEGDVQYQLPSPEQVVRQYFTAWNGKDWPDMYATLSDGFKKIDTNAANLSAFISFAESRNTEGADIISIKEISNDGTTATVEYSVEFAIAGGQKQNFSEKFTLKYRPGDVIPGWKLIHPYGSNVDSS